MKCVVVKENGNVEKLRVTEMEIPKRDSGEVVKTDENSSFKLGDRVMGLVNSGAYAEYCTIPEGMAIKLLNNIKNAPNL